MCGIAGYIGKKTISDQTITSTLSRMKQRGPNFQGAKHFTQKSGHQVYLLHSRLSILDLDARANQPLNTGNDWIVFNGELYNYLEIKKNLGKKNFVTTGDTEILISALAEKGLDILDKCEGMWAFATYNTKSEVLTLCRDRFGEKPLYIFEDSDGFYFGSEPKFIFSLLGRQLPVNKNQILRFLINGYKSLYKNGDTFFEGLKEVPSGTHLSILPGFKISQPKRYWTPTFNQNQDMTWDEALDGAKKHLIDSVELRLRADVPLAFCMSGGVDSNSLISIAKRIFNYDVHGFTIISDDKRYDESEIVAQSVKELGVKHTTLKIDTKDFLPNLRTLIKYHDAPVYTINYFAQWMLQKQIAGHGYHIAISGTSADEIFSGYYDHHLAYLHEMHGNKTLFNEALSNWEREIKPVVRNPYLSNPHQFIHNPQFRDHIYMNSDEYSSWLKKPFREEFKEHHFTDDLLRNRMANELFYEATPVILHEDDLNAMYYSVENRSPFLDRRLFEFAQTIPTRHLIKNGAAKAVLRECLRGTIPDVIIDKTQKVGFNLDIFSTLDVADKKVRDELLNDSPIFDILKKEKIEELIKNSTLPNSESKFLFYFLTSKIFLEEFSA